MYSEEYDDEQDEKGNGSFISNFYNNNKVLVWIFLGIIIFILLMTLLTRGGSNKGTNIEYSISIVDPEGDAFVELGKSVNLIAVVKNDPSPNIIWKVEDPTIATVDNGNIKGLDFGETVVTALYVDNNNKEYPATKKVIVGDGDPNIKLTDVSFKEGDLFMPLNDTYQIALSLNPSRGYVESETFTSSNTNVVTVDNHGLVKSVGEGVATITFDVNKGQFRKELKVYVDRSYTEKEIIVTPQRIILDGELRKMKIGSVERLSYTLEPSNADPDKLIWTSDDESVLTVENGRVKALRKGVATVTVSSVNGEKDRIDIEVEEDIVEVSDINLSLTDLYLTVGQSETITPVILPDNASNKALSYTSIDSSTAYVIPNATGTQATITGINAGTTIIVIRSTNNVERQLRVTVASSGGESSGGSSGGSGSSGGGGGNSATIKVRVNGDTPDKSCNGQTMKYYNNPNVTITLNGGVSKVVYCYSTGGKCTPNTTATSTTSFNISGKGIYTLRIKKYDQSGNEIASSDSGNYYDGALEYYINTKAEGATCTGGGSGSSSTMYSADKAIFSTSYEAKASPYAKNTKIKFTAINGGYFKIGTSASGNTCTVRDTVRTYKTITFDTTGAKEICIEEYDSNSSFIRSTSKYVYISTSDCEEACKNAGSQYAYCINQCTGGGSSTPAPTSSPTGPRQSDCVAGTYWTGSKCQTCTGNTYQPYSGQNKCLTCTGTVSYDRTQCTKASTTYTCEMSYDDINNRLSVTGTASNGSSVKSALINFDGSDRTSPINPTKSGSYTGKVYFADGGSCSKTISLTITGGGTPTQSPVNLDYKLNWSSSTYGLINSEYGYEIVATISGSRPIYQVAYCVNCSFSTALLRSAKPYVHANFSNNTKCSTGESGKAYYLDPNYNKTQSGGISFSSDKKTVSIPFCFKNGTNVRVQVCASTTECMIFNATKSFP